MELRSDNQVIQRRRHLRQAYSQAKGDYKHSPSYSTSDKHVRAHSKNRDSPDHCVDLHKIIQSTAPSPTSVIHQSMNAPSYTRASNYNSNINSNSYTSSYTSKTRNRSRAMIVDQTGSPVKITNRAISNPSSPPDYHHSYKPTYDYTPTHTHTPPRTPNHDSTFAYSHAVTPPRKSVVAKAYEYAGRDSSPATSVPTSTTASITSLSSQHRSPDSLAKRHTRSMIRELARQRLQEYEQEREQQREQQRERELEQQREQERKDQLEAANKVSYEYRNDNVDAAYQQSFMVNPDGMDDENDGNDDDDDDESLPFDVQVDSMTSQSQEYPGNQIRHYIPPQMSPIRENQEHATRRTAAAQPRTLPSSSHATAAKNITHHTKEGRVITVHANNDDVSALESHDGTNSSMYMDAFKQEPYMRYVPPATRTTRQPVPILSKPKHSRPAANASQSTTSWSSSSNKYDYDEDLDEIDLPMGVSRETSQPVSRQMDYISDGMQIDDDQEDDESLQIITAVSVRSVDNSSHNKFSNNNIKDEDSLFDFAEQRVITTTHPIDTESHDCTHDEASGAISVDHSGYMGSLNSVSTLSQSQQSSHPRPTRYIQQLRKMQTIPEPAALKLASSQESNSNSKPILKHRRMQTPANDEDDDDTSIEAYNTSPQRKAHVTNLQQRAAQAWASRRKQQQQQPQHQEQYDDDEPSDEQPSSTDESKPRPRQSSLRHGGKSNNKKAAAVSFHKHATVHHFEPSDHEQSTEFEDLMMNMFQIGDSTKPKPCGVMWGEGDDDEHTAREPLKEPQTQELAKETDDSTLTAVWTALSTAIGYNESPAVVRSDDDSTCPPNHCAPNTQNQQDGFRDLVDYAQNMLYGPDDTSTIMDQSDAQSQSTSHSANRSRQFREDGFASSTDLDGDERIAEFALYAAKSLHESLGLVYDESHTLDLYTHIKFCVVELTLPLGIVFLENDGGCWVTKVSPSGSAAHSGEVKAGDQLAAINGSIMYRVKVDDICSKVANSRRENGVELAFIRYIGPIVATNDDSILNIHSQTIPAPLSGMAQKNSNLISKPKLQRGDSSSSSEKSLGDKKGFRWFGRGKKTNKK